jgi:hypothetical protein
MQNLKFRKNAEIGKLEAETDSFLDSCFYESDVFKGIIDFDSTENNPDFTRRIIVGRTGSGKSALLRKIVSCNQIKVHDTIEAENTVFEHIINNVFISKLIDENIDLRVFYKALWLHVLLVKVINLIHRSSYESFFDKVSRLIGSSKKRYNPEIANEYVSEYKDNFFNDNVITEITNKMQESLSGGANSGLFKADAKKLDERLQKIQTATSSYVSKELLRKQKELIKVITEEFSNEKQVRIVISIDDLDKSWLSSSLIRYDFINALLEAFKELLDIKSVKILISIRTDIIMGIYKNSLRQDEKDLSLIYPISWNSDEIRSILDSRINHLVRNQYQASKTVKFNDVFKFEVNGQLAHDFIIDRTMLRPRDAINFVNLCLGECNGKVELNEDIVLEAEEKFYSGRKQALVKEWKSNYFHLESYLDSLSFILSQEFSISSLDEKILSKISNFLLEKPDQKNCEEHNSRIMEIGELIKVWFAVGVIGIKKSKTLIIYPSYEKPYLDISDLSKSFVIHPLFYRN